MTKTKTLKYTASHPVIATIALASTLFFNKPLYAEQSNNPDAVKTQKQQEIKPFVAVINLKPFLEQCKLKECKKILKKVPPDKLLVNIRFEYDLVKSAVHSPEGFSDTFFDFLVSRLTLNDSEAKLFAPIYNALSKYVLTYNFPIIINQMKEYLKMHESDIAPAIIGSKSVVSGPTVPVSASKEPAKSLTGVATKAPVTIPPVTPQLVNLRRNELFSSRLADGRFVLTNEFGKNDWKLPSEQEVGSTTNQTSVLVWALNGRNLHFGLNGSFGFYSTSQSINSNNCNGTSGCMSSTIDPFYVFGGGPALKLILEPGSVKIKTFVNVNALYRTSFGVLSTDENAAFTRMTQAIFPSRLLIDLDIVQTIGAGQLDIGLLARVSTQYSSLVKDASLTLDISKWHASIDYHVSNPPAASASVVGTIDFENSVIRSLRAVVDYRFLGPLSVGLGFDRAWFATNPVNYNGALARLLVQIGPVTLGTDGIYYPATKDFAIFSTLNFSFGRYFVGSKVSRNPFNNYGVTNNSHLVY
ncbi:MAG: hypothetical protein AABX38_06330 [Candidatus Micrarchaeota archaeon]